MGDPLEALPSPERPAFFEGRLLTADDLRTEQTYHRGRLALALRALAGAGTVAGLRVAAGDTSRCLYVAPGLAIDAFGRLIEVRETLCLDLAGCTMPFADLGLFAAATPTAQDAAGPSRIAEGGRLELRPALEASTPPPPPCTPEAELEAILDAWDPTPVDAGLLLARIALGDPVSVDNSVRPIVLLRR